MTPTIIVMIILGIVFVFASFVITENLTKKENNNNLDLMTVDEDYQFSERELQIIKRKIEDVIAKQAKDILYETNESLSNMANEKTMALGDYAVAVCDEIEKNHKEVMFLYSMLDDKQKEIMKTVRDVDEAKQEIKEAIIESKEEKEQLVEAANFLKNEEMTMEMESMASANIVKPADNYAPKQEHVSNPEPVDDKADFDENTDSSLDDIFAELDQTDIDFDEVLDNEFNDDSNANDIILEMYQSGRSVIEIAKELGLGVGEVKLVIDLYQGE